MASAGLILDKRTDGGVGELPGGGGGRDCRVELVPAVREAKDAS